LTERSANTLQESSARTCDRILRTRAMRRAQWITQSLVANVAQRHARRVELEDSTSGVRKYSTSQRLSWHDVCIRAANRRARLRQQLAWAGPRSTECSPSTTESIDSRFGSLDGRQLAAAFVNAAVW